VWLSEDRGNFAIAWVKKNLFITPSLHSIDSVSDLLFFNFEVKIIFTRQVSAAGLASLSLDLYISLITG
jgi:hypothetical protein